MWNFPQWFILIRILFPFLADCYGLNVCVHPLPSLHVEILTSYMMVLGHWDFRQWLALTNGINALMKETEDSSVFLSAIQDTTQK